MSLVALVPARGGSKGIPGKNIRPLLGKPLIYWVCRAAQDCASVDAVYVATDDDGIAGAVRGLGLSKVQVIGRDPATATDAASTESVLFDFAERVDFDHLALLQATSPLLTAADLEAGCQAVLSGACDSALSVVRQTRFRWRQSEDRLATPENYDPQQRPRRQDAEGFLVENGAFYITSRERLLADRCRIGGRIRAIEMPEDTYFELDDWADWTIIEGLLSRRLRGAEPDLDARIQKIKIVLTDLDGCLTDAGMYYSENGDELKKFNTRDGKAMDLLRDAGILRGIVTQEDRELNARRAAKLKVDEIHQGAKDKVAVIEGILMRHGLTWENLAYLGDDLNDLPVVQRAGLSACPADAVSTQVRGAVHLHLSTPGGSGALREFVERILTARGA